VDYGIKYDCVEDVNKLMQVSREKHHPQTNIPIPAICSQISTRSQTETKNIFSLREKASASVPAS